MSRHHMLPPIINLPLPRPKKIESRRRPGRIQLRGGVATEAAGEVGETFEMSGSGQPAAARPKTFLPVEGADQKPRRPPRLLSEGTLKALLRVQEQT
jgi:hypothetical protein